MRKLTIFLAAILALSYATAQQTVSFWSMWNDMEPQAEVIKRAVTAFEAANPDVIVDVSWMGREVRNLILPALDTGQKVDITEGDMSLFIQNSGHFLPLNAYLSQPGANGASLGETLMPVLVEMGKDEAGELMSVPHQPFVVAFFYNRDHFEAAGISTPPVTWDEFLAASQALKDAGFGPLTTDVDAYIDVIFGYYIERASGSCELLRSSTSDRSGESWRNPAYLQFATAIRELFDNGYFVASTTQNMYPAGQQLVALGEVSMYLNGSWLPAEVAGTSGPDFSWGTFSFPTVPGGTGSITDVMTGAQALAITRESSVPDAAYRFISYLMSAEVQAEMVEAGFATANKNVAWEGSTAAAGELLAVATQPLGWACDMSFEGELDANVITPALTDLFTGKLDPAGFVERLAEGSAKFWQGRR